MTMELIYEKKYPRIDLKLEEEQIEPTDSDSLQHTSFNKLLEHIQANTTYILIPDRVKASKKFIRAAIEISELYELDTRIERYIDRISVNYSLDCCGGLRRINRVFGMADQFSFFRDIFERDITVTFDFFTHTPHRMNR